MDLFCGAGGAGVGYERAGFDVVGVDNIPHPDYPFELIVADAMTVLEDDAFLRSFDVRHASPPCPRYSTITPRTTRDSHPDYLPIVLNRLVALGGLWVVENVPGAPMPAESTVMICGRAMGLRWFKRHRLFASNAVLLSPGCACGTERPWMVTGDHPDSREYRRPNGGTRGRKPSSVKHAGEVMGIDWMTSWDDLADAIPPSFTEFIGSQLIEHLAAVVS